MNKNPNDDILVKKASQLVDKIDEIQASEEYKAVWTLAWSHGMPYKGKNWANELEALRAVLDEIERAVLSSIQ